LRTFRGQNMDSGELVSEGPKEMHARWHTKKIRATRLF